MFGSDLTKNDKFMKHYIKIIITNKVKFSLQTIS